MIVVVWRRRQEVWYALAVSILAVRRARPRPHDDLVGAARSRSGRQNRVASYYDGFARLSKERNVVHIVPDTTQGAMVLDIVRADPAHYAAAFDGFTFFTHAMGRFPSIYPSIPYFMTGVALEPEHDVSASHEITW